VASSGDAKELCTTDWIQLAVCIHASMRKIYDWGDSWQSL
jgi:hypothetical protein